MAVQGEKVGLYLSGGPVMVPECNIYITQPTIKSIVLFGEDDFLVATNLLGHPENITNKVKQGNPQLESFSDFQLLMMIINEEENIKNTIQKYLNFIFPTYKVQIDSAAFNFWTTQKEQEFMCGMVNPFNFEKLQQMINDLFEPKNDNDEPDYVPANDMAAEIAAKIKKGRERKKEMLSQKEGPQSLFGRYVSVLSVGMQMDINIFFEYTPFQLYDSFTRYFSKVSSDLYTKVSTTPLMDVSNTQEPEPWVRNLY